MWDLDLIKHWDLVFLSFPKWNHACHCWCREDYFSRTASDNGDQFSGYDLRDNETVSREGEGEYSAELFSRKAVHVIEAHSDQTKPLFLYLAFQNIHKGWGNTWEFLVR